jgi:hypothetical protein
MIIDFANVKKESILLMLKKDLGCWGSLVELHVVI